MSIRKMRAKRQAEREGPKTLAEKRAARKQAEKPKPKSLRELRKSKQTNHFGKIARTHAGIIYHNVRPINGYWAIDVTNADKTYTLHNRHGAWFHDLRADGGLHPDGKGPMREPVGVARALSMNDSQIQFSGELQDVLEHELRVRGIPSRAQRARQHEEEARAARRKGRKTDDD